MDSLGRAGGEPRRQVGERDLVHADRLRIDPAAGAGAIAALLTRFAEAGLDAVKTENLYEFDGVRGYSQAQGE